MNDLAIVPHKARVVGLDNPFWHALTGPQATFALRRPRAARFQPGVAVMAGLEADDPGAWADLSTLTSPGEDVVLFSPSPLDVPTGWTQVGQGDPVQMVQAQGAAVVPVPQRLTLKPLTPDDVDAMMALTRLTRPGPFGPRTVELGVYLGLWDEEHPDGPGLVAMAGTRARLPGACEISAVCTHPEYRRRGLARVLVSHLAAAVVEEGLVPFLHVNAGNTPALGAYRGLGFVSTRQLWAGVVRQDRRM